MFQKPDRYVDRIFIHCSASDHAHHDNVATMRQWHLARGWSDVGYHFFIRKSGMMEDGRPLERTPAAQRGHNLGTIAICLHGLKIEKFTDAQKEKLKSFCIEINDAYNGSVTFHGHREVAAKACPVIDYIPLLKLDKYGRLGISNHPGNPLVTINGPRPEDMPVLRRGDRGPAVETMQRLLLIKDDGIFGPRTESTVRDFQTSQGLTRDGIVGMLTWTALLQLEQIEHDD